MIEIYDTTLRDGTQREGISLSVEDKLRIARLLDALGIAVVEGGWPGSNPKDEEFFARARDYGWRSQLAAFGSTRRSQLRAEEDSGLQKLIEAATPVCTLFGKTWRLHVTEVLRTALDENLAMIEESVSFLRSKNRRVVYDAEHFFDGYREDAGYAIESLRAAARGGAAVIALCDTNGGSLPWQIHEAVHAAVTAVPGVTIGIHAHNDGECAVANTLAAIQAGARHVQGTINGYGERCGNANLCAIVPNLMLKLGMPCLPNGALARLTDVAHAVAEIANLAADEHMAYVGRSAFAHKGGVHVAAQRRNPRAYQHVEPSLVGNTQRIVMSELGGRGNVLAKAEELGITVDEAAAAELSNHVKEREADGVTFEAAEASTELMLRKKAGEPSPFRLVDYKVLVGQRAGEKPFAEATVQIAIGDELVHTAAEGNGPVSALDAALRKALRPTFPAVDRIHLVDYKVRILDGRDGTQAVTRVLVDSTDGIKRWSTVGASSNILEASWQAIADSVEYGLLG